MLHKLSILFTISLISCSQPSEHAENALTSADAAVSYNIPAGFSVVEQEPHGYFIRLSSSTHATHDDIRTIADAFIGKFDRVDLCLDIANERGDEYAAIIGYQVFNYKIDTIYSITEKYISITNN